MIDRINVKLQPQAILNQDKGNINLSSRSKEKCANYLKAEFNDKYGIEIKEGKTGETVVILTVGGIHREMDLQTLQHLVAMTY